MPAGIRTRVGSLLGRALSLVPFSAIFALSLVIAGEGTAYAEAAVEESVDEKDRRAQEIIRTTMSPFCPGRTIDSCPSPYAGEWRDDVREWVSEGVATEDIRERLKERSPETNLSGAPSTVLDSVLPIFLGVLALLTLALILRVLVTRRREKGGIAKGKGGAQGSSERAELDQRLDEELKEIED